MAITFGNTGAVTSNSFSYSNNGTLVSFGFSSTNNDVTAPTYGGNALTQIGTTLHNVNANRFLSVWYLASAPAGSNTVSVPGSIVNDGAIMSVSGLNATTPVNAANTNAGTSGTASVAVTTTINNAYAVAFLFSANSMSAGTATTLIGGGAGQYESFWRSTSLVTPAGSQTVQATLTSREWSAIGFALNPIVPSNGNFLNFM